MPLSGVTADRGCDHDGAGLTAREDDQVHVRRQRIETYEQQTGPILKYYGARLVRHVDCTAPVECVAKAISQAVLWLV